MRTLHEIATACGTDKGPTVQNDEDYKQVVERFEQIKDAKKGDPDHTEKLFLANLIQQYEEKLWNMPQQRTLHEIATSCGTDKGPLGHNYTPYYDMFFAPLRDKYINLLEIGVWEGASLKMWEEYFPNGGITGLDIHEKSQYDTQRIVTIQKDQSKKEALFSIQDYVSELISIIIDDGSHNAEDQILSFETLFPVLRPGGMYCVEDTLCSYDKERWGKNGSFIEYIAKLTGDVNMNGKMSNYEICANKKQQVNKYGTLTTFERNIEWVFVSCGLCIVKKLFI